MPTSVIMVSGYEPGYLTIFEHLARTEVEAGNRAVVLDITDLLAAPADNYHRGVLRLFGLTYPGHDVAHRMTEVGAHYVRASALAGSDDDSLLEPALEEALAGAVESASITFHRTDRPDTRRRSVAATVAALFREGRRVHRAVATLCAAESPVSLAYVPNGRFPHQRLAKLAFVEAGAAVLHVEKGMTADHAYVQDYSPHDRFRSQNAVEPVLTGLDDETVETIAAAWLAGRAPSQKSRNEYSALWNAGLPKSIARYRSSGERIAGFFTSSQDEFQFQGPEWQLHDWADQWEAFDAIMTRLEALGYRCYLRVHPNLATRAHEYFVRERDGIRDLRRRHPDLVVIWHDDPADSYALLDASDAVVTWASTIGLEASARGIPVWAAAVTYYGLVADVHEILSAEDLERDGMAAWPVDPAGARRFIAYLVRRDREVVPGRRWTQWGAKRPLGATFATIAVSGGTPGIPAAIRSLTDIYRHRSLRANLRARRRRP